MLDVRRVLEAETRQEIARQVESMSRLHVKLHARDFASHFT